MNSKPPTGSAIIGFCSLMTGMGVLASIGFGIYLVFQGDWFSGLLMGGVCGIFNMGLTKVFDEVNLIIRARDAAEQVLESEES